MLMAYMMNMSIGIANVMTLLTNNVFFVRSLFASSNLSSSRSSLPNALITGIPVSISLDTRFTLSTSVCITLNFGMAMTISVPMRITTAAIPMNITQPIPAPFSATLTIPPIESIGAYRTILSIITVTICICWTSFVDLVIRDAVENLLISASENAITLLNTFSLSPQATLAATLDATSPMRTAAAAMRSDIPSIFTAAHFRYDICPAL